MALSSMSLRLRKRASGTAWYMSRGGHKKRGHRVAEGTQLRGHSGKPVEGVLPGK